ncbi:NifU family protein [Mycobacterium sp. CPCC 205372]|uniref:NifU family protein n=1 Tax=Mycobacterium hippophais TaxID=3016340 RepID=A0ABT4PYM7_9MYCO|nr:NifU family protein [Mycobacterium hippophais]MCZ8381678.1 NifU family protein [Mycobacterium hippophais]
MRPPGSPGVGDTEADARWRTAGDRIQVLLDATAIGGVTARERAEQLMREVTDLYGAGLERMMTLAVRAMPDLADDFVGDDLVASLLLVHGLHPHPVERRIADALDTVRPYLGSHGGDVHLLGVDGEVVRLQFSGSCKSCPSSAVTLELAVEDAVRAAAPEIASIEVVAAEKEPVSAVIPAESLLNRVRAERHPPADWHPVPDLEALAAGEVGGFRVAGATVLACRVGDDLFAYRDGCGACGDSLAGAVLHRRMGSADVVLRCPHCRAHFDVAHGGRSVDDDRPAAHLEPVPMLVRDGVLSMALPAATAESVA